MRIVRIDCPPGVTVPGRASIGSALTVLDDRWFACVHRDDLYLYDLGGDAAAPAHVIPGGANHAGHAHTLLTCHADGRYRRHLRDGRGWREVGGFTLQGVPEPWAGSMVLSPSGRLAAAEFGVLPAHGLDRVQTVLLFDATTGAPLAARERLLSARATFVAHAGAELLLISAESYMGVQLIDGATGRTLHAFEPTSGGDFCHTDYDLSPDGARLLTFGCQWAAPYEMRLYDATPWTAGAPPEPERFPLPLLLRQGESLECESVLTPRLDAGPVFECASQILPAQLPPAGSEALAELVADLSPMDREILGAVRGLASPGALLCRHVDLVAGEVVGWSLAPTGRARELDVHALPGRRFVVVDERVRVVDGRTGEIDDHGPCPRGPGWWTTAVTPIGDTLIVRAVQTQ